MKNVLPFVCSPDFAFSKEWVAALQREMPDEHVAALSDLDDESLLRCDVAVVANPAVNDLRKLPQLKWVQSVWAGVEKLVQESESNSFEIARLVDPELANTMAEAVLAWTLYLHRDMPQYARQQSERVWRQQDYVPPQRKTVSLLGTGHLGSACAERLHHAGFQVCGWSRSRKENRFWESFEGERGLQTMLAKTDILVCLLPLTPATRHMVNESTLGLLHSDASLINFSRGDIVDDDALRSALSNGRLRHAVLDVFKQEPLPESAWQWTHPSVTVLPHISAPTSRDTASTIVAANIQRFRESGRLPVTVDRLRGY